MCGFFVVCDRRNDLNRRAFIAALDSMDHRGPDDTQVYFETLESPGQRVSLGFGHKRLAIIDLDARSGQPYQLDGTITVFNGEIYNFLDLKSQMSEDKFVTKGDTEVLARQLAKYEEQGFHNFIGQWSVVHLVKNKERLLLGRDFFGKKPLFYYVDENIFIASSTIQAISQYLCKSFEFKQSYLDSFMVSYGTFLSGNQCHVNGLEQLGPGVSASFSFRDWTMTETGQLRSPRSESAASYTQDPQKLFKLIEDAVLARLVSDREVGLFVSGGVDSTLILAILHKHGRIGDISCMIGETGLSDDAEYAKAITARLGVKAQVIEIDYAAFGFDQFLEVCKMQERPFDLSGNLVAMDQLYSRVEQTDIKVVLDGSGADEIFGGYWDRYAPFAIREAWQKRNLGWLARLAASNLIEPRRMRHAMRLALRGRQLPGSRAVANLLGMADQHFEMSAASYDPLYNISGNLEDAQINDIFDGRLQDWLWQNDRNSMAHSVEARSPFMDRRLYPYVHGQLNHKFHREFNKFALREMFDFVGGAETQWRRQKQGFRYQANLFLSDNKDKIIEFISECPQIRSYFPRITADVLCSEETPPLLLSRLLAVAASDKALRN